MSKPKTSVRPHLFVVDPSVPADMDGRGACAVCHLMGKPGDARHTLPPPVADVRQRAAGDQLNEGD